MRSKFLKGLGIAAFMGIALTALSAGVFASVDAQALASEVNQQNTSSVDDQRSFGVRDVGQTFTVSKDGTIDKVQVPLSAGKGVLVHDLEAQHRMPRIIVKAQAEIREVVGGNVGDVLAESNIVTIEREGFTPAELMENDITTWYTFSFANPLEVEDGTQYALVINAVYDYSYNQVSVEGFRMMAPPLEFMYTPDVYAGGNLLVDEAFDWFLHDDSFAPQHYDGMPPAPPLCDHEDYDLQFKVYLIPAVNPVVFNAGDHGKLNTDQVQVTDIVAYGEAAAVPTVNVDAGYKFVGWVVTGSNPAVSVTDFSSIKAPLEVTAVYEKLPELPKTGETMMLISGLATLALGGGLIVFRKR